MTLTTLIRVELAIVQGIVSVYGETVQFLPARTGELEVRIGFQLY